MSKGLEALKELLRNHPYHEEDCDRVVTIEKELKELKERREMMRRFNEACVPMILENETEKKLKALEIIKDFVWIENDEIHLGLYGDSEIVLRENDFETQEEYELLKKIRGLKTWKYLCENGRVDIPTPKKK